MRRPDSLKGRLGHLDGIPDPLQQSGQFQFHLSLGHLESGRQIVEEIFENVSKLSRVGREIRRRQQFVTIFMQKGDQLLNGLSLPQFVTQTSGVLADLDAHHRPPIGPHGHPVGVVNLQDPLRSAGRAETGVAETGPGLTAAAAGGLVQVGLAAHATQGGTAARLRLSLARSGQPTAGRLAFLDRGRGRGSISGRRVHLTRTLVFDGHPDGRHHVGLCAHGSPFRRHRQRERERSGGTQTHKRETVGETNKSNSEMKMDFLFLIVNSNS